MKFKKEKIPITDLINRNKFVSLVTNSLLKLFFSFIRFGNKSFNYEDGTIVIISLHRLGDTIFTIAAVKEIQEMYGQKIIIFCFPESVPIYKIEFEDIKFCTVRHDEFSFGQRLTKHSAKSKLKKLKPEIILDLTGTMTSASLIYKIKAKQIIGINRKQFSSIYDQFVSVREEPQLVDIYLDTISPIVKSINRTKSNQRQKSVNPLGKILIHPFAGWKEKEWNLKKFIILAGRLNANYRVSLIIQKSQLSTDIVDEINNSNIDLIQTESVEELIKNIKECSLLIDNDSGPVNIANYLGKPTFSIYGATNPDFTASGASHQIFIQKVLSCSSQKRDKYCSIGASVYDCPGIQCMNLLTVEEVHTSITPLVEEYCNKKS
jgi:ADP-heptose:LPS heptosyltransferase